MDKLSQNKDIIQALHSLSKRISSHGGKLEESMAERYQYFVEHSQYGRDCSYARKCKDLFLKYDYEDVKKEFLETLELFRVIEGNDFGRNEDGKDKSTSKK